MEKSGERPLTGAILVAVAVFLVILAVGVLAAKSLPLETSQQQSGYMRHPLAKISPDLTEGLLGVSLLSLPEEVPIIIRLNIQLSRGNNSIGALSEHRETFEQAKGEVMATLTSEGDIVALTERRRVKDLRSIDSIALIVPSRKLHDLAYLDSVVEIIPDRIVHAHVQDSVLMVGAPQVWDMQDSLGLNVTGVNITIAIIDTGIDYTHPDLGGCLGLTCKVRAGYDYVNNDADPMDDNGHGTHVAGIAAANGMLKGVAPDAILIAYKVLDSSGEGYTSDAILAIENATAAGYDIISLSLGSEGHPDDAISLAADDAVNAGIIVVASAGNDGPSNQTINSPGNSRLAITVGNSNKTDGLRFSSSRGPTANTGEIKPDLLAPGTSINSTKLGDGYEERTGTSMSAPHVSGSAALLKQIHPGWTPQQVKGALVGYTKDLGLHPIEQGSGRLMVNQSINVTYIGGSSSLSLGTGGLEFINTTYVFNITNLINVSHNISVNVSVTSGDASATLNASSLELLNSSTATLLLTVNWSQGTMGFVAGRITADTLTLPYLLQIAGYRTKVIQNPSSDEVYEILIRNLEGNDTFKVIMAVWQGPSSEGGLRVGSYNSTAESWNFTQISASSNFISVDAGDIDNDSIMEIVGGEFPVSPNNAKVYVYKFLNNSWTLFFFNETPTQAHDRVKIGDSDNDGWYEVLVTTYNSSVINESIIQYEYNGSDWSKTTLYTCPNTCTRIVALVVGDATNDSQNEIFYNEEANLRLLRYVNGSWNSSPIDTMVDAQGLVIEDLDLGDPDEDSSIEIVLAGGNSTFGWINVYEYNGSYTWNVNRIYNSTITGIDSVSVGDANNDGATDITFTMRGGYGVRLLERTNTSWEETVIQQNVGAKMRTSDIGDALNNGLNVMVTGTGFDGDAVARLHYLIEDPRISQVQETLGALSPYDTQSFRSRVQDSDGLSTVTLYWRNGTVEWNEANMTLVDTQNYTGSTAAQPWNTTVEYFIRATDMTGASNQTPIYNYTVLVNRLGNESDVTTSLANLSVWIANATLNVTYLSSQEVRIDWNGSPLVVFTHPFAYDLLDLRNVTINASQDNLTGWTHVRNLSLPAGVNKTLYVSHWNSSADAVCVLDAEAESILNVSTGCTGSNETLVPCVNTTLSGYRCENVSSRWKVTGLAHSAVKEMENPTPTLSGLGPSGTLTSSSTTLTVTTSETATCKYSATSQGYDAMPSSFSTTGGTSHSQALSGLANGAYAYYVRCRDNGDKDSSEGTISFTVSATSGSSGGGGGGTPVTNPNVKETTYASLSAGKENTLTVDRSAIPATKVGFVNTAQATNVKLSVSVVNTSALDDPLDIAYGYFNVTLSGLYAHELGGAWIEFKVNTTWITEQGASKGDVRLKRQGSAWEELDTAWTKDSGAYSYFNASTPGFSVFAIALVARMPPVVTEPEPVENLTEPVEPEANVTVEPGTNATEPPEKPPEQPRRPRWPAMAATLVLAVLLALAFIRFHRQRQKPQESPPEQPRQANVPQRLLDYVADCRSKGFSDDAIRKRLLDADHRTKVVDAAMAAK